MRTLVPEVTRAAPTANHYMGEFTRRGSDVLPRDLEGFCLDEFTATPTASAHQVNLDSRVALDGLVDVFISFPPVVIAFGAVVLLSQVVLEDLHFS